jgi:hypothetical protein
MVALNTLFSCDILLIQINKKNFLRNFLNDNKLDTKIIDGNLFDCVPHRQKRDRRKLRSSRLPYKSMQPYLRLSAIFFSAMRFLAKCILTDTCKVHVIFYY